MFETNVPFAYIYLLVTIALAIYLIARFFVRRQRLKPENMHKEITRSFTKQTQSGSVDASVYRAWGDQLFGLARMLDDAAILDESIDKYSRSADLDPHSGEIYRVWGNALSYKILLSGNTELYPSVFDKYARAASVDAGDALTYINWGNALYELGYAQKDKEALQQSIEKYKKGIELKPDEALAYNNMGLAMLELSVLENNVADNRFDIEQLFGKARELADTMGAYGLTQVYSLVGEKDRALEMLEVAMQSDYTPMEYVAQNPNLAAISAEPRFKEIIPD